MAWITDSLRSAIAAVNPFQQRYQQAPLQGIFTSQLAVAAYLSSGMLRKVIQIPAADRVREWRDWQAENDQITAIEAEEKRLGLIAKVRQAEVLRGIGGGALILVTAGKHEKPLSPDTIRSGGLIAINVVNRWELQARDFDKNLASPTYGQPARFVVNGGDKIQQEIHPSRVICFRGDPLPSNTGVSEEDAFWGDSRLVRVMSEVNKADNASLWFSELVKKAKLLRIGIPNLAEMNATEGGKAKLAARVETIAMGENLLNATVFSAAANKDSAGETISDYQVTWAGIPAMMDAFDQRVAAVADIPFTRLMGRSPAGMNATGEHDSANYHAMVAAGQELELRPCLEQLDAVLLPSAGVAREGLWWKFSPLGKPTPKEEADRLKTTAEGLKIIADLNAMPDQAFNAGLQGVIEENGWLPGSLPILSKMSEDERFGIEPDPTEEDPSALTQQQEGGDPTSRAATGGDGSAPVRRAANDKVSGGDDGEE